MTPFQLFKKCEYHCGRKYRGNLTDFEQLRCHEYFCGLNKFLIAKFGKNNKAHITYIEICAKNFGSRFSPYELMSSVYWESFEKWRKINENPEAYRRHLAKSLQYVFDFCVDNEIYNLKEYVVKWAVPHIISEKLNENIAYVLEVQGIYFTAPEKKIIKKLYLKNLKHIEERMNDSQDLRVFIENEIAKIKDRLTEIKSLHMK